MAKHEDKESPWFDFIGVKFPKSLVKAMDRYISRDTHATRSELIRTAVREKIQRDMPDIWAEIMENLKQEEARVRAKEAEEAVAQ